MKIGAFARKHSVTIDTLRYYIKLGLLSPQKIGLRHSFDARCDQDMALIKQYKTLQFSIMEIRRLMSAQKLFANTRPIMEGALLSVLKEKADACEQRIRNERQALRRLQDQIAELEEKTSPVSHTNLSTSALNLLACPRCDVPFKIENEPKDADVLPVKLRCTCGYSIRIQDNILMCEKPDNHYSMEAPDTFIRGLIQTGKDEALVNSLEYVVSGTGRNIMHKGGNRLYLDNLPFAAPEGIGTDGCHILVSSDQAYLRMVSESLAQFTRNNFLFINATVQSIPLKKQSMSFIYDFFYSDQTALTQKKRQIERLCALMTDHAEYLHIGLYLDKAAQNRKNVPFPFQIFMSHKVKEEFQQQKLFQAELRKSPSLNLNALLSREYITYLRKLGHELSGNQRAFIQSELYYTSI